MNAAQAIAFELPTALEATEPPEARGLARDEVRLMVASTGDDGCPQIEHARFRDLAEFLAPGDLLVVNVSATLPAAIAARLRQDGTKVRVHYATRAPGLPDSWAVIELRSADGARPIARNHAEAGDELTLAGGASVSLVAPYASSERLWLAHMPNAYFAEQLHHHGEPIRYGYIDHPWPLSDYQTVYATTPGSAEMPSAGRPFSHELLTRLAAKGVTVAPIRLHTGVSSPERHEPPFPEQYKVPEDTARLVESARSGWRRVIAVGTTVVRALETAAGSDGRITANEGWTRLVIGPECPLHVIDGLITGWHEPEASHLQMLEAVAGRALLERSYEQALENGYLWHEFGDSHLLLR